MNDRSQMPTSSFSASNCRWVTGRPFRNVPLRLCRSSMIEVAVDVEDPRVLPADGGRFQHDVAGRMPAEDHRAPSRGNNCPGLSPCNARSTAMRTPRSGTRDANPTDSRAAATGASTTLRPVERAAVLPARPRILSR